MRPLTACCGRYNEESDGAVGSTEAAKQTTQAKHETAITDARGGLSDGPEASSIARTGVFVMRSRHQASTGKAKVVARTVNEGA
jgi:hypothetical protein